MKSRPEALRSHRERKGHTLTSLASAADLSKQRLWQLEDEAAGLLPTTAKRIADALGVDITDIATLTDEAVAT
jgi:DNA-binding XRE family transcriptional regulator